jgi:hypothetical protein
MAKVYKTANGKQIDIDGLRLTNEHVIAVGNMKVNARGDQLGPGGRVVKTHDQLMKEYYTLSTPVASDPMDSMQTQPQVSGQSSPITADTVINPDSGIDENEPEIVKPPVIPGAKKEVPPQFAHTIQTPAPVVTPKITLPQAISADPINVVPHLQRDPDLPPPGIPAVGDIPPFVPVELHAGTPAPEIVHEVIQHKSDPTIPAAPAVPIRGKMAGQIAAKTATVTQKEMLPPKKANGVQRF